MPAEPYRTSIEIAAPPAAVYPFLTRAELILRWMGDYAVLNPRPGGEFTLDINGVPVRGHYIELDPPHRVVIAWGHAGSDLLPPGASTVEITLEPSSRGTRLQLEHRDLPTDEAKKHAIGWPIFLARLALAGTGYDAGPDPFGTVTPPDTER
ncbi:MAG: SRPBCC domain-containing protein [Actinomycetota bacterium]|nr:SRPBCC domain-containing protein [Actinomycetota bacterium]